MAWKNNAEIFQIFCQSNNQEFLWNDTKLIHSLYQVDIHKWPETTLVDLSLPLIKYSYLCHCMIFQINSRNHNDNREWEQDKVEKSRQ